MLPRLVLALCLVSALAAMLAEAAAPPARAELLADAKALEAAGVADEPGLLAFFEKQTTSDSQRRRIGKLIEQLGDDDVDVRENAAAELKALGFAARTALQRAKNHQDLEVARRARRCLEHLEGQGHRELLTSAIRVLAARRPAKAVGVLLAFLPDAVAAGVEEDVIRAVTALAVSEGKAHPDLVRALTDKSPLRRAAAGEVLAHSGLKKHAGAVRELLKDDDPSVRFRVAVVLVCSGDREAVPVLIGVLPDLTRDQAWQVDDVLYRLGGEQSPRLLAWAEAAHRKKYRDDCLAWWKEHGAKADLTRLSGGPRRKARLTARASRSWNNDHTPDKALDGDRGTWWNSGDYPQGDGQWIELDAGAVRRLGSIELVAAQSPEGLTTHEVWVSDRPIGGDRSKARLAHTFKGRTRNGDVLRFEFPRGTSGRYVQVRTTESLSWVGWLEIEVGVR